MWKLSYLKIKTVWKQTVYVQSQKVSGSLIKDWEGELIFSLASNAWHNSFNPHLYLVCDKKALNSVAVLCLFWTELSTSCQELSKKNAWKSIMHCKQLLCWFYSLATILLHSVLNSQSKYIWVKFLLMSAYCYWNGACGLCWRVTEQFPLVEAHMTHFAEYQGIRYAVRLILFCSFVFQSCTVYSLKICPISFAQPIGSVFERRLFNVTQLLFEVIWRGF